MARGKRMNNSPDDVRSGILAAQARWMAEHRDELGHQRRDIFTTSSGRQIKDVYTPVDLPPSFSYIDALGFPGDPPYTRGETPGGYRSALWSWEFYAGFGSAKDANQRYRYLMEQGGTGGVSIALDLPTQIGLDSDDPLAAREIGRVGVAINTLQDIFDLFDGIALKDAGKIFTTANCIGPVAFAWFYCLAEARGEDPRDVVVTIQNDPLKEYVARGTQFLPVAAAARLAVDVVEHCTRAGFRWYPISVSGSHMKQAGGTCAQEAGFTLANAIEYADQLNGRGLSAADFAPLMELHFCTDMDFFEEIAKYRATRRLWSEILAARYGAPRVPPRIHAATSGLPLTAQQSKNNIVRITLQALAQILGGVAQTRTASYDEALAIPSEDAVTLSIRTNQIIAHETGVADVVDPIGGSYYVETLTDSIYNEMHEILNKVEKMGGAISAIDAGYFQKELAEGAYKQQVEQEEGRRLIVGVNSFVEESGEAMKIFRLDPDSAERQKDRLRTFKAARDEVAWRRALGRVRQDAVSGANCMEGVIAAVKAGATVGEISQCWREVYGTYTPQAQWLK